MKKTCIGGAIGLAGAMFAVVAAEPFVANYDEAKVPAYTLPDPLVASDGRTLTSARQWTRGRREEVLGLFRDQVYGHSPGRPRGMRFEVRSEDRAALGGRAREADPAVLSAVVDPGSA